MTQGPPRRRLRASTPALVLLTLGLLAVAATFVDAHRLRTLRAPDQTERQALTSRLGLTDPALMTEARYGRHLTQADLHSAFQDHPLAFDHFPTGSLWPAPRHHADLDPASAPSD